MRHESAESRTVLPEEQISVAPLKQEIQDDGRAGRQAEVPPDLNGLNLQQATVMRSPGFGFLFCYFPCQHMTQHLRILVDLHTSNRLDSRV